MSELLSQRVRQIYGRDLYGGRFWVDISVPADDLEHGDSLRVTVERLPRGSRHRSSTPVPRFEQQDHRRATREFVDRQFEQIATRVGDA